MQLHYLVKMLTLVMLTVILAHNGSNKKSCGAGHNKTRPLLRRSERPKTAISLHSQSLGGSTGLPEDHNQTK